jgi:hypothetical protein
MYFEAQLVVKSYIPHTLEKGMWFIKTMQSGEKQIFVLDRTFLSPKEEEQFITDNGYPVKLFIVEEYMDGSKPAILATPEEIGWFDEDEDTDELRDITLLDINYILAWDEGFLLIDIDGETGEPTLAEGKVILSHLEEDWDVTLEDGLDPEDYHNYGIMCDNCGSSDIEFNSSDLMICNNCGWEEDNEDM